MRNSGPSTIAQFGLACVLAACGGRSERIQARGDEGGSGGDSGVSAAVCGVTGGRANGGFELGFSEWSQRISVFVERDDGSLLAYRPQELVRIGRDGDVSELDVAPAIRDAITRGVGISFAPRGQAMLMRENSSAMFVFDGDGMNLRSSFAAPNEQDVLDSEFSDSGELVAVTYGELGLEKSYPASLEIRHIDGRVISTTLPRRDDPLLPASDDRMIWRPGLHETAIAVTDLEQNELYRVEVGSSVERLGASEDGNALVLQLGVNEIVHVEDGVALAPYLPDAAVTDVRIAPGGDWSAFTHASTGRVHLFEGGNWRKGAVVALESISSFDVNDSGDVIVAGRDASGFSQLILLDANLDVQFTCGSTRSLGDVGLSARFSHDGQRVFALLNDRLSVFSVR